MIEALIFGFFAYFGTEIGEFAHKQYDRIEECIETRCDKEKEDESVDDDSKTLSTTVIGEDNG